ncbi:MAG: AraC family transcriptional regulator [Verrucomicrobiae bacterium]|nr:AraC family transcriptional regulator [Verrucomicrobiae bacterium]
MSIRRRDPGGLSMSDLNPPASLEHLVQTLPKPRDYFQGVSLHWPGIPQKVLLFSRGQELANQSKPGLHHRFVMILSLQGRGEVIVDEKFHQLGPHQGILIFPFQRHYYARFRKEKVVWLFITFEFANPDALPSLHNRSFRLDNEHLAMTGHIVNSFLDAPKTAPGGQTPGLWLSLLLVSLQRAARRRAEPPAYPPTRTQTILQKMTQFLARHSHHSVPLTDIAQASGVSISHLRRICRQTLNLSLGRFARQVRINQACTLLRDARQNITEIAATCGFNSVFAFSRAFKKETGLSPLKYRQRYC